MSSEIVTLFIIFLIYEIINTVQRAKKENELSAWKQTFQDTYKDQCKKIKDLEEDNKYLKQFVKELSEEN